MTLAVYRTVRKLAIHDEDASGLRGFYFVAPAGLTSDEAWGQRRSDLHASQITALSEMIDMQNQINYPGGFLPTER